MKIRTVEELSDAISKELAWRRKELTAISSNVKTSRDFAKNTALRAGVALLYAHWEGFIKNAAQFYLIYVSSKKLKYNVLKANFVAIAMKEKVKQFEESNKSTIHTEVVNFILEQSTETSVIPTDKIIRTGSNLKSDIFIEIMATLGLDCKPYELNFNLIDLELLSRRNSIAHGEALDITESDFELLYNEVTSMINIFEAQIINAAVLQEYLR